MTSLTSLHVIELSQVTLTLDHRHILHNITLSIQQGEFIGVLGPNGAGKTTLMRALLGLVTPTVGSICILGRPARRGDPAIGYLPQMQRAICHRMSQRFTGYDFMMCAANGHRWGKPWARKSAQYAVDHALALVDAAELAKQPLADLSGGERQRLLFAQCLLDKPRLLLLDEPLISLDPHHQKIIVRLAQRLQQQLKMTVLFCAHELNPLLPVLDRVLYLGGGHAALGAVDEVIRVPVLSRLYGSAIEVLRVDGRIFVMLSDTDIEKEEHRHEV